jgi:hypothetical protein
MIGCDGCCYENLSFKKELRRLFVVKVIVVKIEREKHIR